MLTELLTEAGLPPGALNVVTGLGADAGGPLSAHPDIDKVVVTPTTLVSLIHPSCTTVFLY